jgi:hypothetical protein
MVMIVCVSRVGSTMAHGRSELSCRGMYHADITIPNDEAVLYSL